MGYDYNKALDYPHSYYKDICTEGLSSRHALCLKRNRNGSVEFIYRRLSNHDSLRLSLIWMGLWHSLMSVLIAAKLY